MPPSMVARTWRVIRPRVERSEVRPQGPGAWFGTTKHDAGNRALAGAAAGGAAGLVRGALRVGKPSRTFRGFVNRCLSERGYDVIG